MDSHDVMAFGSVEANRTASSRARSDEPCGSRRDSMEDADATQTRKRPRLDSGDRGSRSMSADRILAAPGRGELMDTNSLASGNHLERPRSPNLSKDDDREPPSLTQTPNKVTINVRAPQNLDVPEESSAETSQGGEQSASEQSPSSATMSAGQEPANTPMNIDEDPTASSPSMLRSPEIEVAEVEDMDMGRGGSQWVPIVDVLEEAGRRGIMDQFPYSNDTVDLRDTVANIAQLLEKGDLGNGEMLLDLGDWFSRFLLQTEHSPRDWWDLYDQNRDFWDEVPLMMEALLRRSIPFGNRLMRYSSPSSGGEDRRYITELFRVFASLTTRFIQIDIQILQKLDKDHPEEPDLVSGKYTSVFQYSTTYRNIPLWSLLIKTYGVNTVETISDIAEAFLTGPLNGLRILSEYSHYLSDRMRNCSRLVNYIYTPIHVAKNVITLAVHNTSQPDSEGPNSVWRLAPRYALDLFANIDAIIQDSVGKQTSILTIENGKDLVIYMTKLLSTIVQSDPSLARRHFTHIVGQTDDIASEDLVELISNAWKFVLLKKYITEGRMELRVLGIETMQQDLVSTYTKYKDTDAGINHPVMRYLAQFILNNKLVDYIVGVASHPQLISRSANIVGFLVVTDTYTPRETDAIWNTVATSQDPRVVGGIISMLKTIINLAPFDSLIHLCRKLDEMPVDAFDAKVLDFGRLLLHHIRRLYADSPKDKPLDTAPYNLCVRLIRQSALTRANQAVSQFASEELTHLLALGPSEANRKHLYKDCMEDIDAKAQGATGSICAINILLKQKLQEDVKMLTEQFDLTRLLIDELVYAVSDTGGVDSLDSTFHREIAARLELLSCVIVFQPTTISAELGDRLWNTLFANDALGETERNSAWTLLSNVTNSLQTQNVFIDRCIHDYVPHLNPIYFTAGLLSFVQKAVQYQTRLSPPRSASEHEIITIPGSEQLWQIVLRAPRRTIEIFATRLLVEFYLDSPVIRNAPHSAVEATHLALVERCVQQLTSAAAELKTFSDGTASGEDEPMIVVAPEEQVNLVELRFTRSLLFLREIIHGMRIRPHYINSRRKEIESAPPVGEIKGEPLIVHYQAFQGGSQTDISMMQTGTMETSQEFALQLSRLTGFQNFTAIAGGQILDLKKEPNRYLRDMKIGSLGLFIIKKLPDDSDTQDAHTETELSALEVEVQKHFDEFYDLLGLDEKWASEIYAFMSAFAPHETVRKMAMSNESSVTDVFPMDQLYKVLYSLKTLEWCLSEQLQKGLLDERFISHGVGLLVSALTSSNMREGLTDNPLKFLAAAGLVKCLLDFLKEPVSLETSEAYFSNEPLLVDCLCNLLTLAKETTLRFGGNPVDVVCQCFETVIEASLHSDTVWTTFSKRPDIQDLLQDLLLKDTRAALREGIAHSIFSVCSELPRKTKTTPKTFSEFFWRIFLKILPQAVQHPDQSQQLFNVSLSVFRAVGAHARDDLDLESYTKDWSHLLLSHKHDEFVGRDTVDFIVLGFSSLLNWCIQLAKSFKKPLNTGTLMQDLFTTHLFPDLSPDAEMGPMVACVPVLDSQTRREIYALVLSLSQETSSYVKLLELASEMVPRDYGYEVFSFNFERSKSIRSPTGYPGLKNLSNTCYLNSLFTQLFMNVPFRSFMLNANIADGEGSQRLLAETKKLFAFMQDSWLKFVDPTGLADSIKTWDNEQIDVTIQMDVDEFYNLLFDRWEGQILSPEDKQTFRSFYGGQLVQQVKSKECLHISEREEPFSAIQCDIKGKANLQDSLKAYVEGEIMEGDNKYSCTSCNRHVDAVKRTCLKEVPDNLIFHLKRFDFDLVSMQRSKINDCFEFPATIDMKPYKVDYLSDPENPTPEDVFQLVGVLVHSGTAESGHYYSYIRERPDVSSSPPSWVEFNDADVSQFDPAKIPDQCFGGLNDFMQSNGFQQLRFHKNWNAYMLFYQRVSTVDTPPEMHLSTTFPVKLPVDLDLANHIAMANELFIRRYCLFDPAHAPFIKSLLDQLRDLNKGTCSEDHRIEQQAIWLALEHVDQVISRTKDLPDFDGMMFLLLKVIGSCADCCKISLDWVINHHAAMRNLLMRNPLPKVRQEFARLVVRALQYLRGKDQQLYGIEVTDNEFSEGEWSGSDGAIQGIIGRLDELYGYFDLSFRSWDDYFGLLCEIAEFGSPEVAFLMRAGFLRRCLELLVVEWSAHDLSFSTSYQRLLRILEKGKKPSYTKIIELLRILIEKVELLEDPAASDQERATYYTFDKLPLTAAEEAYMKYRVPKTKNIAFITKMLDTDQNSIASAAILKVLLEAEPDFGYSPGIQRTISAGIAIDPASLAAPYLQAAIVFCENTPDLTEAKELVTRTARDIETIGGHGGREHLDFFRTLLTCRNPRFPRQFSFSSLVLHTIMYWAPPLLIYWEETVREDVFLLVQSLLFQYGYPPQGDDNQFNELINFAARHLTTSCIKHITTKFIQNQISVEARMVDKIIQVMKAGMEFFDENDLDDRKVLDRCDATIEDLARLVVDEVDDAVSEEWDNDSNIASDSDVDPLALQMEATSP
ncbi:MAG: hypothetical protein M1819_006880 [Sarea resinae]|nr:MAG: hypothetical protein M1819_006880 [Sarea resinae]